MSCPADDIDVLREKVRILHKGLSSICALDEQLYRSPGIASSALAAAAAVTCEPERKADWCDEVADIIANEIFEPEVIRGPVEHRRRIAKMVRSAAQAAQERQVVASHDGVIASMIACRANTFPDTGVGSFGNLLTKWITSLSQAQPAPDPWSEVEAVCKQMRQMETLLGASDGDRENSALMVLFLRGCQERLAAVKAAGEGT